MLHRNTATSLPCGGMYCNPLATQLNTQSPCSKSIDWGSRSHSAQVDWFRLWARWLCLLCAWSATDNWYQHGRDV